MAWAQRNLILIGIAVVTSQAGRPKPLGTLGIVIPNISGFGWSPTSTPPPESTTETTTVETTTAATAPAEISTSPPETGWPAPPGWSNPSGWTQSTPVDIEMVVESTVVGEGEAGATQGSQTIVTGDASNPAVVQILAGSYASLGQGSSTLQISGVGPSGDTNTFQGVDSYNFGDAGEHFGGLLAGNNVNTVNGGSSFMLGQGGMGQGGFTHNSAAPTSTTVRK